MSKIIVVGGGASGMMAAIAAARRGASVLLLERMRRVGKKLLATGNGRCNLTNTDLDMSHFHGSRPTFASEALRQFNLKKTLAFFERLGIVTRVEQEGRVFPLCGQASSVLDVLRYEMDRLGVETFCDAGVREITHDVNGFRCVCADKTEHAARRVILAGGGKSTPNLGSNGTAFRLAERLGHSIVEPFPALVQVRLDSPFLKQLQGVRIEGAAEARVKGLATQRGSGELLWADYGISGPPILQISRLVSEQMAKGKKATVHLDLFPDMNQQELVHLIEKRIGHDSARPLDFSFVGLIHKRLIPVILREAGVENVGIECGKVDRNEIRRIAARLKNWPLDCAGVKSWMFSQVTAGGIDVRQVDPKTMESRVTPGLFFSGEALDIDGDSGGYNLQWAWSSGAVAGAAAAA